MSKTKVSPEAFVAECNRRLALHPQFTDEMAFDTYPSATSGRSARGYCMKGPTDLIGIYAEIAIGVSKDYEVEP